jgi:hypothetical protein
VGGLIRAAVRFEWRRLTSQRRFLFWALIGVPFLLPLGLGPIILRSETAAFYALSILSHELR